MRRTIEQVWEADGLGARALLPLSWLFGAVTGLRNAAYDAGLLRQQPLGLPALSVGNLSVGGTGKTPVSAWVAQRVIERGHRPAILLRGYGDDEPTVHRRLTPGAIVVADPDRVAGAARAKAEGAQVLILDDAFQHRRARRDVDLVLVAAEQGDARRLLPAGPLREGRRALSRAHALVVTRKSASLDEAERVAAAWVAGLTVAGHPLATAVLHLAPGPLRSGIDHPIIGPAGSERPLASVAGQRVLAISGVGAPAAFEAQLRGAGAELASVAFPDHHAYSDAQVAALARRARDVDLVICTLKDAVKLGTRWPANALPFWYLSQVVKVERGERILTDLIARLAPAGPP